MVTRWIAALRERLAALLARDTFEDNLDEELRFHLDQATARHIRRGLSRGDARRAALRQLGNVESIKEDVRAETGVRPLQDLGRDVHQAFRQLVRCPGFSSIAIATIAICLAANTAVFSIVYSVLLKPLPFPESHRLVRLFNSYPNSGQPRTGTSVPEYFDRRKLARTLDDVALYREESNTLGTVDGGRHAFALRVTPSFSWRPCSRAWSPCDVPFWSILRWHSAKTERELEAGSWKLEADQSACNGRTSI